MLRDIVERALVDGSAIPTTADAATAHLRVTQNNVDGQVTSVTSHVTTDRSKTGCVYEAPNPNAIRRAATADGLPVETIAEVRVVDPCFYTGNSS